MNSVTMRKLKLLPVFCFAVASAIGVYGQSPAAPAPDVLIFTDGEKLIGHLVSANGSTVVFKSDMAGQVTVDWKKIQELRSAQHFAAIRKDVKVTPKIETKTIPQGPIVVTGQQLQVESTTGAPQTIPLTDLGNLVEETSFQNAFRHTSFLSNWKGGATAGLSLTEATQNNDTVTAALNMVRTTPGVNWLDTRSRTILDFNDAYGKLTSPGTATVKTSLLHADAEQDWYSSPRVFVFANAAFDHSISQGLDLQQTYGGGVGVVAIKRPKKELDFKASADYINQRFSVPLLNKSLIGSIFSETYNQTFTHGILLSEQAGFTPAWNDTKAYSAFTSAGLTFPVYHRLGITLGALDNLLNDPPPGFRKNSFQFTAGATYAFQ